MESATLTTPVSKRRRPILGGITEFFLFLDILLIYCFGEDYCCVTSDFTHLFEGEKEK